MKKELSLIVDIPFEIYLSENINKFPCSIMETCIIKEIKIPEPKEA